MNSIHKPLNKINILHLIDHCRIGGPGKTIINSAKYINHDFFKIAIASFVDRNTGHSEFSQNVRKLKIPYLALCDDKGISINHLKQIDKFIKEANIKILHTHGYKADLIGTLMRRRLKGCHLVTTYHGWIKNNFLQRLYINLNLLLSFRFDGIIAVSEALYTQLPWFVKKWTKCDVIHNALVLNDYPKNDHCNQIRKQFLVSASSVLLGVVGRLSAEKGCFEMVEIFADLKQLVPQVKLIFVGEGPLQNELKRRARMMNIENDLIFAGYQHRVNPFYAAIDVLINPSHTEGLSNVILEAMACRVPVVATRVGGNSEVIQDGYNGYLVEDGQYDTIVNILHKLCLSPKTRKKIVKRGYETIHKRFEFSNRMRKVEQFYYNIVDSKPNF